MANVIVGSAKINEKGTASGGKPGDQTGREVATQNWYRHTLGWVVIRPLSLTVASKVAIFVKNACANPHIGYDQPRRDSLLNYLKAHPELHMDPSLIKEDVQCDCSALVRAALVAAGYTDTPNFRTINEPQTLKATGHFQILTDTAYTDHPDYLCAGDILCTKTSGHTVVVLNDGPMAHKPVAQPKPVPKTVEVGDTGPVVRQLQTALCQHGADIEIDGLFGPETAAAVIEFQKARGLDPDGVVGPLTWGKLL